jgi:hypothetical protein
VIFYGESHGNYHESRMPYSRPDARRDGFYICTFSCKFFLILQPSFRIKLVQPSSPRVQRVAALRLIYFRSIHAQKTF